MNSSVATIETLEEQKEMEKRVPSAKPAKAAIPGFFTKLII